MGYLERNKSSIRQNERLWILEGIYKMCVSLWGINEVTPTIQIYWMLNLL